LFKFKYWCKGKSTILELKIRRGGCGHFLGLSK